MLQWYPRLIALLVFALLIASFVAHVSGRGRGFTWD
jgi:hypothetical protein